MRQADRFGQVKLHIRESGLLSEGDRVVIGVSGGADSVFLLYVLAELRDEGWIRLSAVHVHHGIRGDEADEDAEFVQKMCERLRIPCHVEYVDVPALAAKEKLTLEEAGRKARYACFAREKERIFADKLAVAHHKDDSAETILFNLVRGSGIKGLCGIAPVQGDIVRPLLNVRRAEIEEALLERGISWRIDSTNGDVRYSRNRIRGELIPYLERELNPETVNHLNTAATMLQEIDTYMEEMVDRWLHGEEEHRLNLRKFGETGAALQSYLIRRRISEIGGLKDIGREHIEAVKGLTFGSVGKVICLPGGRKVRRDYEDLVFIAEGKTEQVQKSGFRVEWQEISRDFFEKIQFDQYTKCFDYDTIKGDLHLRTRQTGDRIAVFADGRTQSLKEYMINVRIPAQQRDQIPILFGGNEVLWIVGHRASERHRVTDETRRILLVTVKPMTGAKEQET